jgi:transposase InsO family protein
MFAAVHGLAHPGMRATRRLLAARAVWKGMKKDINNWCRDCQQCYRAKVHKQPAAGVVAIPVPQQRFGHVHIDLVGPLPISTSGLRYVLTMVDRTTRWIEAVPLTNIEAATCAEAFIASWVARFGVPAQLTSDQGRQFTSAVWARVSQLLGVEHITTTAYHPQSNGMVERIHRQLKDALRARLADHDWPLHLPWVLLGLRAAPKEDSGVSSAELLYGVPLALPGQFLTAEEPPIPDLLRQLRSTDPLPTRPLPTPPPASPPAALQSAAYVYVRRLAAAGPLAPQYAGPYLVVSRGPKVFQIRMGEQDVAVSVDCLKPHLGSAAVLPAQPPRRGRPSALVDGRSFAAVVTGGGTVEDLQMSD